MSRFHMPKRRIQIFLLAAVTLLLLGFIFSRSLKSVEESRAESGRVLEWVRPVLSLLLGEKNVTDHLVRKLAHFAEFAALGLSMAGLTAVLSVSPLYAFFGTLVCAVTDETLQLFSARGSQVQDVWLDFCGSVCGVVLFLLLRRLFKRRPRAR